MTAREADRGAEQGISPVADLRRIADGSLEMSDFAISVEALERQATVAAEHGNSRLAENFRRAAELTTMPDDEVLKLYEALRPGRSSSTDLLATASRLEDAGMPRCAALVREAAEAYEKCDLG